MNNEAVLKRITDGVAVGGITLPAWFPTLEQVSYGAAQLLPILSALWLVVQIVGYVRKRGVR